MNRTDKNTNIPPLDTQTANQLLNNVFTACDMTPSVIPVEVLESWGNYKKPAFNIGRFISYFFLIILVLTPLMFLKPSIVAERTGVTTASDAVYDIHIKTLLPLRSVTATLNDEPVALTESAIHEYTTRLTDNGVFTVTTVAFNGQTSTRSYTVSYLDKDKPELLDSYSKDGYVYLKLLDTYSGINYEGITGLTVESYDAATGTVEFKIPDTPSTVTIPDNAGNELTLLLSPVN